MDCRPGRAQAKPEAAYDYDYAELTERYGQIAASDTST